MRPCVSDIADITYKVYGGAMGVVLIFKIGAIGLAVAVLHQVLARSGREEYALLTTMAGVLVVVMMLLPELAELISTLKKIMDF